MQSSKVSGFTRELGKPAGWDEAVNGPCESLAILDTEHNGQPVMVSKWLPTPEELASLNAGQSIFLWVFGTRHPAVALTVGSDE